MRNRTNHHHHSTRNEHDITIHHDLAGPLDNLYHRLAHDDDAPTRNEQHINDNRTDHDVAGDEHINHLVTSREHYDDDLRACVLLGAFDDAIDEYQSSTTDHECSDDDTRFFVRAVYDAAAAVLRADNFPGYIEHDKPNDLDTARANFIDALAVHGFAAINGSQPAARDALRTALASDRL